MSPICAGLPPLEDQIEAAKRVFEEENTPLYDIPIFIPSVHQIPFNSQVNDKISLTLQLQLISQFPIYNWSLILLYRSIS